MADKNTTPSVAVIERCGDFAFRERCCVHTKKIYDACREIVCAR